MTFLQYSSGLGKKAIVTYKDEPRVGDHIWYISDLSKFKSHYPNWRITYDIDATLRDIAGRWLVLQSPL